MKEKKERASSIEELKELGAIYIENILDGMEQYPYETLTFGEQEAYQRLHQEWEKQGEAYVDFYYGRLERESRQKVESILDVDELNYLRRNPLFDEADHQFIESVPIVFPLDEMLLRIIVKLNAGQMLFSTIYFLHPKSTWWGNYDQQYVIFHPLDRKED